MKNMGGFMKKTNIIVYPNADESKWLVKKQNSQRASFSYFNKEEAEEKAKKMALDENSKMIVINKEEKVLKKQNFYERPGLRSFHVLRKDPYWIVKASDRKIARHKFAKKSEAIRTAQKEASDHCSVIIIHNANGRIEKVQDMRGIPVPS
jgi:hypothetical protein